MNRSLKFSTELGRSKKQYLYLVAMHDSDTAGLACMLVEDWSNACQGQNVSNGPERYVTLQRIIFKRLEQCRARALCPESRMHFCYFSAQRNVFFSIIRQSKLTIPIEEEHLQTWES